jgi:MFS family permease
VGVTVIIELPIFWKAGTLAGLLTRDGMFVLSMSTYAVRAAGYTLLTQENVWLVLCLESLHGVTFACMWTVSMSIAKELAPRGWETTMPVVVQTVYSSVGTSVGAVLGGYVMQHRGAKFLYGHTAIIIGSVAALHVLILLLLRCTAWCGGHAAAAISLLPVPDTKEEGGGDEED